MIPTDWESQGTKPSEMGSSRLEASVGSQRAGFIHKLSCSMNHADRPTHAASYGHQLPPSLPPAFPLSHPMTCHHSVGRLGDWLSHRTPLSSQVWTLPLTLGGLGTEPHTVHSTCRVLGQPSRLAGWTMNCLALLPSNLHSRSVLEAFNSFVLTVPSRMIHLAHNPGTLLCWA